MIKGYLLYPISVPPWTCLFALPISPVMSPTNWIGAIGMHTPFSLLPGQLPACKNVGQGPERGEQEIVNRLGGEAGGVTEEGGQGKHQGTGGRGGGGVPKSARGWGTPEEQARVLVDNIINPTLRV